MVFGAFQRLHHHLLRALRVKEEANWLSKATARNVLKGSIFMNRIDWASEGKGTRKEGRSWTRGRGNSVASSTMDIRRAGTGMMARGLEKHLKYT